MKKITVLLAFGLCCGTAQAQFGTGADGALTVTGAESLDVSHAVLFYAAPAGSTTLGIYDYAGVSSSPPFSVGDEIIILARAVNGGTAGQWELATVASVTGTGSSVDLGLSAPLQQSFGPSLSDTTTVQQIPHFTNVTVEAGGVLSGSFYENLLAFRASGTTAITGVITTSARGYAGASSGGLVSSTGDSELGFHLLDTQSAYGGGGGAGDDVTIPPGGGGGGYGTPGDDGESTFSGGFPTVPGSGGGTYGSADLSPGLIAGSGGGNGGKGTLGSYTYGGNGGDVIFIATQDLSLTGTVEADGEDGGGGSGSVTNTAGGGGGGAGGTIWIQTSNLTGSGTVSAAGGNGGAAGAGITTTGAGGNGGDGRIRIDTPTASSGSLSIVGSSLYLGTLSGTSAIDDWALYH